MAAISCSTRNPNWTALREVIHHFVLGPSILYSFLGSGRPYELWREAWSQHEMIGGMEDKLSKRKILLWVTVEGHQWALTLGLWW